MKYLASLIIILALAACNQTNTSSSNVLESRTWIVYEISNTKSPISKGDTIKFSSITQKCRINNLVSYKYISNDTVLFMDLPSQKVVFAINKNNNNIMLSEQYSKNPINLILTPIK